MFFFTPWTSKVPVNLGFFKIFTGTILRSRALCSEGSRVTGCVHGHFFGRFHGHFSVVYGHKILKCLRVLFAVHGQFFGISKKKCAREHIKSARERTNSANFVKMFTGTFKIHGHFFGVHGQVFFALFTGKKKYSRANFRKCSRAFFRCSREKKTTLILG